MEKKQRNIALFLVVAALLLMSACKGGVTGNVTADQLAARDRQIASLQADVSSRNAQISSLRGDVDVRQTQINDLKATISKDDQRITELQLQVTNLQRGRPTDSELKFRDEMREYWEDHIFWTRQVIISKAEDLSDESKTIDRLLQNPDDFADTVRPYFGSTDTTRFRSLLRDHLTIAAELVDAVKAGDTSKATDAERRWYDNADEMATFLHKELPNWDESAIRAMLNEHLRVTKQEAVDRLGKNYAIDIQDFDRIKEQALDMADMFSDQIVAQYPTQFGK